MRSEPWLFNRNIFHFDRVMQPEDTEGPARLKPVWHQFKTPLCHKNQTTHQRFESFHSVAVDTGLLPWWCYYRQLQFDRQMKSVKQQNYFINNFRERKRNGAESLQGWASPAQVYFTYLSFFFLFGVWNRSVFLHLNLRQSWFSSALKLGRGFLLQGRKWK